MILSIKIDSEDEEHHGFTESGFLETEKILEKAGIDIININDELMFYERTKKLDEVLKIPVVCIG